MLRLWWQSNFLTVSGMDGVEAKIDPLLETQFAAGRLYAAISSRPGQSGRADGYILEGKELEVSRKRGDRLPIGALLELVLI